MPQNAILGGINNSDYFISDDDHTLSTNKSYFTHIYYYYFISQVWQNFHFR